MTETAAPAMQKHFLVTISNDVENLFGVHFLCSFFRSLSPHQVTLFHLCRLDAGDMKAELLKAWEGPSEGIQGALSVGARRSLDRSARMLRDKHMLVDQMLTKTVAERYGKVRDILAEGSRGLYDAIVLGRRASYTLQWLIERPADEIALGVIREQSLATPIWICPQVDPERQGVLIGLDGSEAAYRAADHVGYMLADQPHHRITLLQVTAVPGAAGDDEIFARARAILHEHQIADERIEQRSAWGLSSAGTLLGEADKGGYAAIAVGLGGSGRSDGGTFSLAGGTTARLICKNETASLWCCP